MSVEIDVEGGNFEMVSTVDQGIGTPISPTTRQARDISWSSVNFVVGGKTNVLTDCWGRVKAGQVCAIMGPSGAGKSSLLNVLAGRSASAPGIVVEGKIKVGQHYINPVTYRKNIAYVMQDDSLMPTATPREALRFSANLRLPSSLTAEEIEKKVETLLAALGLTQCADVIIGGALIKGISGGQRKRTSVGVELITDPTLLFLDEPTTGLDSHSAFNLVKLLKDVASNCAILCTIHQPSSEVFCLFDIVIFMKNGKIFYQGPVEEITPFYGSKGQVCPENYNPADFVMSLCQSEASEVLEKQGLFMPIPDDFTSDVHSSKLDSEMLVFKSESSFGKQILAIAYREMINFFRDINSIVTRVSTTVILSLIVGLIFLRAGSEDNGDIDKFNTHVGAMSILVIFALFGSAESVLLSFPFERPMIIREYVNGTYDIRAYFLSKILVEAPVTFCQMLLKYLIAYFMIELQGNFIFLVLTSWGMAMVSNSVAMALGCIVADVKDTIELSSLIYEPQVLFAGFFIRTSQIPNFLRWAQYICGMKYAMNLVLLTEFQTSRSDCSHSPEASANCHSVLSENDIDPKYFYVYVLVLLAIFVGFRLVGGFFLDRKAKRFY